MSRCIISILLVFLILVEVEILNSLINKGSKYIFVISFFRNSNVCFIFKLFNFKGFEDFLYFIVFSIF